MSCRHSDLAVLALAACCVMLQGLQSTLNWDMAYLRTDISSGSWWRLVSGQLVHNNVAHLLMNIAGLSVLYIFARRENFAKLMLISMVPILGLIGIFLFAAEPQLQRYVGLSGALHGCALLIGIALLRNRESVAGGLLVVALLGKQLWECSGYYSDTRTAELIGIRVATEAHFWALVAGGLVALCWMSAMRKLS